MTQHQCPDAQMPRCPGGYIDEMKVGIPGIKVLVPWLRGYMQGKEGKEGKRYEAHKHVSRRKCMSHNGMRTV